MPAFVKLTPKDRDTLLAALDRLVGETSPQQLERQLADILAPLLSTEGYSVERSTRDYGLDFVATRAGDAASTEIMGIELKALGRKVSIDAVQRLIGSAYTENLNRVILLSQSGFTTSARELAGRVMPIALELKSFADLKDWIFSSSVDDVDATAEVRAAVRKISDIFARLIATNPLALRELAWFDIERLMAEVFEALGFKVTLTPPAKDGGKDLVLECVVEGKNASYYVEIKHWRSATKVGAGAIQDLIRVVAKDKQDGGLFLSTHGYTQNAFEQLTTIDKQTLTFGGQDKVVALCKTYVKAKAGLWSPPTNLTEVLYLDAIKV